MFRPLLSKAHRRSFEQGTWRATFTPDNNRSAEQGVFTGVAKLLKRHPLQRMQLRCVPLGSFDKHASFALQGEVIQYVAHQRWIDPATAIFRKDEEIEQMHIVAPQREEMRLHCVSNERPSV